MQNQIDFISQLTRWSEKIENYIYESARINEYKPEDIRDSVIYYTSLGGKRLRPAVLLASCVATGGSIEKALPTAASVELFHTWTLIHDDIIDRDSKRRHGDTVHVKWEKKALNEYEYGETDASHFGLSVAILAGDVLQGWSIASLLPKLYWNHNIDPKIVLTLIQELGDITLRKLVEGETLDILFSSFPIEEVDPNQIINMLWKKTGILYGYCGMAGAMIGLGTHIKNDPIVSSVSEFSSKCGTAFQIQDDILGIIGEEDILGKPVGSDIREGKRTLCLWNAYRNANAKQKKMLDKTVGNLNATDEEIQNVINLIIDLGGVEYAAKLAQIYIEGGIINEQEIMGCLYYLEVLEDSEYKLFLQNWANYMINREF